MLTTPPSGKILKPCCFSIHFDDFSHTNFKPRGPWVNVNRFAWNLAHSLRMAYGTSGLVTRSILENLLKFWAVLRVPRILTNFRVSNASRATCSVCHMPEFYLHLSATKRVGSELHCPSPDASSPDKQLCRRPQLSISSWSFPFAYRMRWSKWKGFSDMRISALGPLGTSVRGLFMKMLITFSDQLGSSCGLRQSYWAQNFLSESQTWCCLDVINAT